MPGKESVSLSDKQAMLAALRQRIRHLDPGIAWRQNNSGLCVSPVASSVIQLGVPAIDCSLPGGGLYAHALHEVVAGEGVQGKGGDAAARAAASSFAAFLLGRVSGHVQKENNHTGIQHVPGSVLWCCRRSERGKTKYGAGNLYAPGLVTYGLDHKHLLIARGLSASEVLWAMEEGLASGALTAVIGEPGAITPVALRRLQLAAETGRTTAVLLTTDSSLPTATAAFTRWRVSPLPFSVGHGGHVGSAASFHWRVELLKCRGGRPVTWTLNEDDLDIEPSHNPLEHSTNGAPFPSSPSVIPLVDGIRHRPVPQAEQQTRQPAIKGLRRTG